MTQILSCILKDLTLLSASSSHFADTAIPQRQRKVTVTDLQKCKVHTHPQPSLGLTETTESRPTYVFHCHSYTTTDDQDNKSCGCYPPPSAHSDSPRKQNSNQARYQLVPHPNIERQGIVVLLNFHSQAQTEGSQHNNTMLISLILFSTQLSQHIRTQYAWRYSVLMWRSLQTTEKPETEAHIKVMILS